MHQALQDVSLVWGVILRLLRLGAIRLWTSKSGSLGRALCAQHRSHSNASFVEPYVLEHNFSFGIGVRRQVCAIEARTDCTTRLRDCAYPRRALRHVWRPCAPSGAVQVAARVP